MTRPSQPSIPPSEPAPFRHLGRGPVDRSVRIQMVIALIAGLVMIAVPLYLWRRPKVEPGTPSSDTQRTATSTDPNATLHSGNGGLSALVAPTPAGSSIAASSMGSAHGVALGDTKVIKCVREGATKIPPEQCDRQSYFEEALGKAIRDNASCASAIASGGTLNYVLEVDYKRKKVHAWAGKSGSIRRKNAKEALSCVNHSLPTPDWAQLPHQYARYQIALLATYPPGSGSTNRL